MYPWKGFVNSKHYNYLTLLYNGTVFWIFKKFLKRINWKRNLKINLYCAASVITWISNTFNLRLYIVRDRLPMNTSMNTFVYAGYRGRRSHAHTRMISRDLWVEIARTMKYARSCFLTTLAQFHSNRSRLIHGVQFNPFSRFDQRRGRSMEKHRSYRRGPASPLRTKDPTQSQSMGGFHTPIHYTYFKLSISPRRLPCGSAARIRRKGSGWIAIGTTMKPYNRRKILGSDVDCRRTTNLLIKQSRRHFNFDFLSSVRSFFLHILLFTCIELLGVNLSFCMICDYWRECNFFFNSQNIIFFIHV